MGPTREGRPHCVAGLKPRETLPLHATEDRGDEESCRPWPPGRPAHNRERRADRRWCGRLRRRGRRGCVWAPPSRPASFVPPILNTQRIVQYKPIAIIDVMTRPSVKMRIQSPDVKASRIWPPALAPACARKISRPSSAITWHVVKGRAVAMGPMRPTRPKIRPTMSVPAANRSRSTRRRVSGSAARRSRCPAPCRRCPRRSG